MHDRANDEGDMEVKPANCPLCGHHMHFDYDGTALEIYGYAYQNRVLECSNDKCEVSFGLVSDLSIFDVTESQIVSAWNLLVDGLTFEEQ